MTSPSSDARKCPGLVVLKGLCRYGGFVVLGIASLCAVAMPAVPGISAAAIDARKPHLSSFSRHADDFSLEGTTVTAWTMRNHIEKIEVKGLGERGRLFLDFYWRDSTLIAARDRFLVYDKPISEYSNDEPMRLSVERDDYLEFAGGKLTRWSRGGKSQPLKGTRAAEVDKELNHWASTFYLLMTSPEPQTDSHCDWKCEGTWSSGCRRFHCEP
jgi:hypothetical protein